MPEQTATKIQARLQQCRKNGGHRLDLSGLRLKELPDDLQIPQTVFSLNLSHNELSAIPTRIFEQKNLRALNLSGNRITKLPAQLNELKDLVRIDLNDNHIHKIENGFGDSSELTTLYLARNYIRKLPTSLANATHLKVLTLAGNPLEIPLEVVSNINALRNYLMAVAEGETVVLREAKLLIVGEGNAGKTYLARALTNADQGQVQSTEGIEITRLQAKSPGGNVSLNVWDFGGQEIYHATHQYFLTKKSLYLFVWIARADDDLLAFDYWLNVISLLSDKSPTFVVQNKIDERAKEIDQQRVRTSFSSIVSFANVSALRGDGVVNLRDHIIEQAVRLPHFNQLVPLAWLKIRQHLESLQNPYISYSEYTKICRGHGLNESKAAWLSEYFHVLGTFLHFPDNIVLAGTVFLKPEWATNATYRLFDDEEVIAARGFLNTAIAKSAWSDYPEEMHPVLLELLKRFELCFELRDGAGYVIPARLPAAMPEDIPPINSDLTFIYEYDFMPAGIIERTIVRLNNLIKGNFFWKNGVVLQREQTTAIILGDRFRRTLTIQLAGEANADLLSIIRNEIDQIHNSLNKPSIRELLPCICIECSQGEPYFFDHHEIQRARSKQKKTIECRRSFEQVEIEILLGQVDARIESKEREVLKLLNRIADKIDDEESLGQKINEVIRLQPNLFGVGINLNYLIAKTIKSLSKGKSSPHH